MADSDNSQAYHKTLETVAVVARQTNVGLELDSREQYGQFLELVKADLEERKQLFLGHPAYLYWSGVNR